MCDFFCYAKCVSRVTCHKSLIGGIVVVMPPFRTPLSAWSKADFYVGGKPPCKLCEVLAKRANALPGAKRPFRSAMGRGHRPHPSPRGGAVPDKPIASAKRKDLRLERKSYADTSTATTPPLQTVGPWANKRCLFYTLSVYRTIIVP